MSHKPTDIRGITLSGPYYKFSCPYGTWTTLHKDEWFVFRQLTLQELQELDPDHYKCKTKETCLGQIVRYHSHPRRFIISQLFPAVTFNSLKKAIKYLADNEGKLVFCS